MNTKKTLDSKSNKQLNNSPNNKLKTLTPLYNSIKIKDTNSNKQTCNQCQCNNSCKDQLYNLNKQTNKSV